MSSAPTTSSATALWHHLASSHGIISRPEAYDLGLTNRQISHRVKTGEWIRLGPSVFRVATSPLTWTATARAAALSCDGLISHRSAARLWGVGDFRSSKIEVVVPDSRRRHRPDVLVHRSSQFELADPTVIEGVPVTGLSRTILDTAGLIGPRRLDQLVDAALRTELITWPDLLSVLSRHSARGRNGCGRLRTLLDDRYGDMSIPDSRWNRMVGQLLADSELPCPVYEYEIFHGETFVARVDLAYPSRRIAVECDSVRYHLNRASFEADPRRRNALSVAGWQVLSFTWSDYIERPWSIVRTVTEAYRARSQLARVD